MSDEQFNKLVELLGELGKTSFQIALERARADTASAFLWSVVFVILFLVGIRLLRNGVRVLRTSNNETAKENEALTKLIFGMLLSILCGFLAFIGINNFVLYLIAPRFHALELLAGLVVK